MRELPTRINLLAHDWMRAQVFAWLTHPRLLGQMFTLAHDFAPFFGPEITDSRQPDYPEIAKQHQAMLDSIRVLGYRQDLVVDEFYHGSLRGPTGAIRVRLDGNGSLCLLDGSHRILALLIRGVDTIEAEVVDRAPEWLDFVRMVDGIGNGYLYGALPHPDFDGWPVGRQETRVLPMADTLRSLRVRSAVDLGCCTGAFTVDLAAIVPFVRGVDQSADFVRVARWRATRRGNRTWYRVGDAMTEPVQADLVCLLSILHHLIRVSGMDAVRSRLTELSKSCRFLLTEYPGEDEPIIEGFSEGQRFAREETGIMEECGWVLERDFGPDKGFPGTQRNVRLWRATWAT